MPTFQTSTDETGALTSSAQFAQDEQRMENLRTSPIELRFPEDFDKDSNQNLLFARYRYRRPERSSSPVGIRIGAKMALPIPASFPTSYGASWDQQDLGLIGKYLGADAGTQFRNLTSDKDWGSKIESLKASFENLTAKGGDIGKAFTIDKLWDWGSMPFGGTGAISANARLARNPFAAFIYTGPQFRSFQFSWKLVPRNMKEANTIRGIIREFKEGMTPVFDPQFQNNLFDYPDIFQIQIQHPEHMFQIGQTVLKDLTVDYHGEGQAAYFKGKVPFSIMLQLNFQEIVILTRDDIDAGY